MNKRFFITVFAVVAMLALAFQSCETEDVDDGESSDLGLKYVDFDEHDDVEIRCVKVLFDNSSSMKGYFEFSDMDSAKKTINLVLLGGIKGLDPKYLSFSCGTKCWDDLDDVSEEFSNSRLLNGKVTRLDEMIEVAVQNANDTTVSLFASDLILSFGSKEWRKNRTNLSDLEFNVESKFTDLNKKGYGVAILQYYSDFNGNHYYNCTENNESKNLYEGKLMRNRPFYVMAVGKVDALKKVVCRFDQPDSIYTSFGVTENDYADGVFTISVPTGWQDVEEGTYDVVSAADLGDAESKFTLDFDTIKLPRFVSSNIKIGSYSDDVIKECRLTNDGTTIELTLLPYKNLQDKNEVCITLISDSKSGIDANIDEDARISDITVLEKKTFGFASIDAALNKVFQKQPDTVAVFKFKIIKKK